MNGYFWQGKRIGFCRLSEDVVLINSADVPDSDTCIIECANGHRYKRDIPLTYKAQELPGVSGFIFVRI